MAPLLVYEYTVYFFQLFINIQTVSSPQTLRILACMTHSECSDPKLICLFSIANDIIYFRAILFRCRSLIYHRYLCYLRLYIQ